jgi:hypothetical protein
MCYVFSAQINSGLEQCPRSAQLILEPCYTAVYGVPVLGKKTLEMSFLPFSPLSTIKEMPYDIDELRLLMAL